MAITFGTVTARAHTSGTTETIASVDCNIGSDRVLYVGIAIPGDGNYNTGITFNGTESLTRISRNLLGSGATSRAVEVWRLVNPTATSASVVLTQSLQLICELCVVPLAGVDQTTPNDTIATDGANDTTSEITAGMTWGGGDDVLFLWAGWRDTAADFTADAGVTERANAKTSASSSSYHAGLAFCTDTDSATPKAIGTLSTTVVHAEIAFNVNAAATGAYTLTAAAGSFALTGTATGVTAQRALPAAQASFTLTGTATGLLAARNLPAALGTFALAGTNTGLTTQRLLTADAATCTLSGTATGLTLARHLTASASAFVLTGVDATLTYSGTTGYTLTASTGTFALTGQAATLAAARLLTAGAGTLTLTGSDAALTAARLLTAGTGAVTLTGADAGLAYGRYLAGGTGAFTLAGTAALFPLARVLSAATGAYTLTGVDVVLDYSAVYRGMIRLTARYGATLRLTGARGPAGTFYAANGPAVRLTPREPGA